MFLPLNRRRVGFPLARSAKVVPVIAAGRISPILRAERAHVRRNELPAENCDRQPLVDFDGKAARSWIAIVTVGALVHALAGMMSLHVLLVA